MATQQDTIVEGVRVEVQRWQAGTTELWLKAKAKEAVSRLPLQQLPRKCLQRPLLAAPEFACRFTSLPHSFTDAPGLAADPC